MADRSRQLDVTHAMPAHLGVGDFDAAALANDAAMANPLVLAAMAFPILGGPKNLFAEKTFALWLVGTIVNGFWLHYLARRSL